MLVYYSLSNTVKLQLFKSFVQEVCVVATTQFCILQPNPSLNHNNNPTQIKSSE